MKRSLREQVRSRPRTRLLFVRRPDRRRRPELRAYAATSRLGEESLRCHALDSYDDLRALDLASGGEALDTPLFIVCTHGKHDQCCARYGRPVFEALAEQLEEEWVWQSTHVGGDRFAGNVVCLPHGVYYGRLDREDAVALLDEHLAGRVLLEKYRGRSIFTFGEQAAERGIREREQVLDIDGLELVETDGAHVTFRDVLGHVHRLTVLEEPGEPRRLTCTATDERRPPRFRVTESA